MKLNRGIKLKELLLICEIEFRNALKKFSLLFKLPFQSYIWKEYRKLQRKHILIHSHTNLSTCIYHSHLCWYGLWSRVRTVIQAYISKKQTSSLTHLVHNNHSEPNSYNSVKWLKWQGELLPASCKYTEKVVALKKKKKSCRREIQQKFLHLFNRCRRNNRI